MYVTHVCLPPFPEVECEVVQDVLRELLLELRVQPDDLYEAGDVEALEVAVGEGAHVAARLDKDALCGGGRGHPGGHASKTGHAGAAVLVNLGRGLEENTK